VQTLDIERSSQDLSEEKESGIPSMSQPSRAFLVVVGVVSFLLHIYYTPVPLSPYLISFLSARAAPRPLYLRIEQAVLQLSLGKLTGLGGGGAGGE
jgi:hypothetical protein